MAVQNINSTYFLLFYPCILNLFVRYININGKITAATDASVPSDNRAFRYGYGLFETMLFCDGAILLKELHWQRLFSGLEQLHFDIPKLISPQYFEDEIIQTVKKNKLEKYCRVRLQLFAGSGGLFDTHPNKAGFIIECFDLEPNISDLNENGLVVGIASGLKKSPDSLSNLKTSNALIYAMAALQAKANKWNDALIYNTNDHIIESTIANIFWVKNETIYTPPLSSGCVAGIMRKHIISSLAKNNIIVTEKDLSELELLSADELFVTNAIRRIKWIHALQNKVFYTSNYIQHINNLLFY